MALLPELRRPVVVGALGSSAVLGMLLGVAANLGLGGYLELPDEAAALVFDDAPTPGSAGEEGSGDAIRPGSLLGGPRPPDRRGFSEAIVRRNIFDSAATFVEAADGIVSQDCKDSKITLLATVVADMPDYSSALISDGGRSSRALGYKVGDEVAGEGRILTIEQKKVCLDGGGCICMGGEPRARATEAVAAGDDDGSGVTKLSDTRFLVDRSFMEKQLGNVEALATQIRAVPKTENGQVVGFRLSAIRKGSTFDKLGIKNGDVVHSVNGNGLTSAESALSLYQGLTNESNFNFEITRRNQKMTLDYEVR
jgi:general secretion pathway protein C